MSRQTSLPNPSTVINTMHAIKYAQCTMSYMNQQAVKFIFDGGLMRLSLWPAWVIIYTEAGIEYIHEHSDEEEYNEHD